MVAVKLPKPEEKLLNGTANPQRIVHLDLKGAAPKVKYMEQIFPLFSSLGATGILVEYEDMFPYDGNLGILRSTFAYSVDDIAEIKRLAKISNLEIIPLVQTFGHLEFVLKHEKYVGLREVEEFPNTLNPRIPQSLELLKEMLQQVMKLHPEAKHFHIGSDQVLDLGMSKDSKHVPHSGDKDLGKLFLSHVDAVAKFMTKTWPGIKLLMWDEMLREISTDVLQESGLPKLVTPVVSNFMPELDNTAIGSWISKYQAAGCKDVWFASAFKGATAVDQMWTQFGPHLRNHLSWLNIVTAMHKYPQISLQGIMLTGWQRYDHFSVLCELLPVGMPSLGVCLQTLKHGSFNEKAQAEVRHILGCEIKLDKELWTKVKWDTVIQKLRSELEAIYYPDTVEEWMEENVNYEMNQLRMMARMSLFLALSEEIFQNKCSGPRPPETSDTSLNISNLTVEDSGVYTWRIIQDKDMMFVCYEGSIHLLLRDPYGVHSPFYRTYGSLLGCVLLGLLAAVICFKLRSRKGDLPYGHPSRERQQRGDEDLSDVMEEAEESV
ncbi:hexosaminidase D-like [Engraulis encrasicolus]|uniref:hexosaminidase D-like n=1 Tax=Engraulis encrasicolus TaxID=184585 RepID=UPI002FD4D1F3